MEGAPTDPTVTTHQQPLNVQPSPPSAPNPHPAPFLATSPRHDLQQSSQAAAPPMSLCCGFLTQ